MNEFENRNRGNVPRQGAGRNPNAQNSTSNHQRAANGIPKEARIYGADRAFSERGETLQTRPRVQNRDASVRSFYGDKESHSDRVYYGRSQSRSGHKRVSGRSSVKKHGNSFSVNPKGIMIVLSALVTTSVIVGVMINYRNKIKDSVPSGNKDQTTELSQSNGVSAQTLKLYSLDMSEVDPGVDFPKVRIYDGQGRVVFSPVRQPDGKIEGTLVYEYSDEGVCVMEKMYGADGILVYKDVPGGKSDGTAKTLYETQFDGKNNFSGYTETLLDDKGVVLEKVQCSYNGVVEGKYYYEYDDAGRVARENRYTPYGDLSVYTDYKYDFFGNVTEKAQYDPNGKEVLRDVMEYDGENRIVREEHYTAGVCKSYADYTYNSDGTVIKKSYMLKDEYTMTYVEVP